LYGAPKRGSDFLLSFAALVLLSPLFLAIGLAVWLEDRLPVFFVQERSGLRGRVFRVYKFRSMRHAKGVDHVVSDLAADSRVTRVGRFLRATAMDELPALFSILKGDMSFVGPRALYPRVEWPGSPENGKRIEEIPGFEIRSLVRPGLTGFAQVYAPKDIIYEEKFRYDALYVRRMGPWLDLKLFFLSLRMTLLGRWEGSRKIEPGSVSLPPRRSAGAAGTSSPGVESEG